MLVYPAGYIPCRIGPPPGIAQVVPLAIGPAFGAHHLQPVLGLGVEAPGGGNPKNHGFLGPSGDEWE